jgi:hypothetical protein
MKQLMTSVDFVARLLGFVLATAIWTTTTAAQVSSTFLQAANMPGQAPDSLERLTAPSEALPTGCRLTPKGPLGSNPAVVSDSKGLALISMFVLGMPRGDEKAALGAGAAEQSGAERQAAFDRLMLERAEGVETGYAAFYREDAGSPEIGVYAIRLKKPLTEQEARTFRATPLGGRNYLRILKGQIAIFAWSDARANAPDRGCFDVVRQHLEKTEVK